MSKNIDTLDANGNILHHIGPSTEWTKEYDAQGREIKYTRTDGQVANTTYAKDGTPTVKWNPPLPDAESSP